MPKAKNTSPPAYVCRFKGGQYDADYPHSQVKGAPVTLHPGTKPATVHTAATRSLPDGGKKVQAFTPAHVGGGHPRDHQG